MRLGLRIAVSVGCLAFLVLFLPWSELREAVGRFSRPVWVGVLGGFLLGHALGLLKWRGLLLGSGCRVGARDATRCYSAGLFANICLPSIIGGDVLRALLSGRIAGRLEAAFLAGIADRLLDSIALTILIGGGLVLTGNVLGDVSLAATTALGVVAVLGAILSAVWMSRRPLNRWPRKLRRPVARTLAAMRKLMTRPGPTLGALLLALTMQSSFVLLNVWIGRSLGISLPVSVWFVAWPLAKLVGILPISLGGIGVRDAVFGAILLPLGVPLALGVVAHLIWQTVLISGGLLAGAVWWLMSPRRATGGRPGWRNLLRDAGAANG